jgi:hypothetical protein
LEQALLHDWHWKLLASALTFLPWLELRGSAGNKQDQNEDQLPGIFYSEGDRSPLLQSTVSSLIDGMRNPKASDCAGRALNTRHDFMPINAASIW